MTNHFLILHIRYNGLKLCSTVAADPDHVAGLSRGFRHVPPTTDTCGSRSSGSRSGECRTRRLDRSSHAKRYRAGSDAPLTCMNDPGVVRGLIGAGTGRRSRRPSHPAELTRRRRIRFTTNQAIMRTSTTITMFDSTPLQRSSAGAMAGPNPKPIPIHSAFHTPEPSVV
ncbi:Uncharacterised protein [Clostridioides difficile]|nr:Uncharacterised protein [Clostridioides difficile]